ncbi:hypothetical protein [Flammeovirga pacifica]|uniref:Uncharacterized protein n=1 Tax=Flammeovirga pacifica TaxID=915059 RepID=A0A1S1YY68_FLAPC|nr:hypothetical protein [Flammeovirga pacifica]OHX65959.1 hypothetical protein NH26_06140 [Flammeovirga pacifica]
MNQFFIEKSKYFKILFFLPLTLLVSCDFFGLDSEMKHLTLKNLELQSQMEIYELDPAGEWVEGNTVNYYNTRDSVVQKNFIDINQISKGSINRIQIQSVYPTDSTLYTIDSVKIFFSNLSRDIEVGYLYEIPANSTPKLEDARINNVNNDDLGALFRSDTVIIKTDFHLRALVRTDTLRFQVNAIYGLTNH